MFVVCTSRNRLRRSSQYVFHVTHTLTVQESERREKTTEAHTRVTKRSKRSTIQNAGRQVARQVGKAYTVVQEAGRVSLGRGATSCRRRALPSPVRIRALYAFLFYT